MATLSLNGTWDAGPGRRYERQVPVPGLAGDPRRTDDGPVWYRRHVDLPGGDWTHATLFLHGARFCPRVYVNGELVSVQPGGMALTVHPLASPAVKPGARIELEVELASLKDVPPDDASKIPAADSWRSNVSSCLWDSVRLRLHGPVRIARLIPFTEFEADALSVYWELADAAGPSPQHPEAPGPAGTAARAPDALPEARGPYELTFEVCDELGAVLARGTAPSAAAGAAPSAAAGAARGRVRLDLAKSCRPWSPEDPRLYRLRATLRAGARVLDSDEFTWGLRDFHTRGLGFSLNGHPFQLRAGTVVWHRWCRDPEARELAWDVAWFERHIVRRLKDHGANGLRFHLGPPPEAFLDLCDRHGLLVQAEWSFFHGMKASRASLLSQWRAWFDACLRHPCVGLIHPWNETEGDELKTAFSALEELAREYPPLVLAHRDVLHVHKYWWSLFENVGLYYDSAAQFPQPVMADEFGGNYLDGQCRPGGYPALAESFLRFLGHGHTPELRLELQTEAHARVAEYWRRLGVAGLSPFCLLGSPEDGNHHFLGPLREGRPKPVWDALTASYAPLSCSLDVWDRNFAPSRAVTLPLHLFNATGAEAELDVRVGIVPEPPHGDPSGLGLPLGPGTAVTLEQVRCRVGAYGHARAEVELRLPDAEGSWRFVAQLEDPAPGTRYPVVSSWRFRTLVPRPPAALDRVLIGCPAGDPELCAFLERQGLAVTGVSDPHAGVLIASRETWKHWAQADALRAALEAASRRGAPVILLDVGPRFLGQGYLEDGQLGPLQGGHVVAQPRTESAALLRGVRVSFRELPEPESCLHPFSSGTGGEDPAAAARAAALWERLDRQATWLWNGLRGGLVAPACGMEVQGLSRAALVSLWQARGAEPEKLARPGYCAYGLAGFYAFSEGEDEAVAKALRERVKFLVEDAPALQVAINPHAPLEVVDLSAAWRASAESEARALVPLALAGKNLTRTPLVRLDFAPGRGGLVLSQLLTAGRLAEGFGTPGPYGVRYDPAAAQFVLNLLSLELSGQG